MCNWCKNTCRQEKYLGGNMYLWFVGCATWKMRPLGICSLHVLTHYKLYTCSRKWMMQFGRWWMCKNRIPKAGGVRVRDIFEVVERFTPKSSNWVLHWYVVVATSWHLWRAQTRCFILNEHKSPRSIAEEIIKDLEITFQADKYQSKKTRFQGGSPNPRGRSSLWD